MANALSDKERTLIDAYWRAANYLSVGQIYLYDNPLLKQPLSKEHLKPLYLAKQHFAQDSSTIEITVDELPTLAGIDPYNKLIDRNPEDNLIATEKK